MKFFVNNIGMLSSFTRFNAFWKTWKPQYLRCGDDVEENNDSMKIFSFANKGTSLATDHQRRRDRIPGKIPDLASHSDRGVIDRR